MPLYKEWSIGDHALAGIWKIEEPESFFTERIGVISDIKAERRRMERLAGRFLLKHLKEDFPIFNIKPDEHDKPRIDNNEYFFSISHSWPYVAAVVDPYEEAGIDIQTWHPSILKIQFKFLSEEEQGFFHNDPRLLTMAWCAKEAAYKWQGRRGIEFIDHLPIVYFDKTSPERNINIYANISTPPRMVSIETIENEGFMCSFVTRWQDWAIY